MADVVIKQNDTGPPVQATLKDATGAVVPLAGSSIKFKMRRSGIVTPVIDDAATIVDAAGGQVKYEWSAEDTAAHGLFEGEFEVTFAGGVIETFPNDSYISISIIDDIS